MSEYQSIKCPYCGAIDGFEKQGYKLKCGYCDCEFYVASEECQRALDEAHNYLIRYKFEDADDLYSGLSNEALDNGNNELYAMAQWGRLLAYFGVVYIKSFKNKTSKNKISIPTFALYDKNISSIIDSEFYKNIMSSNLEQSEKNKYKQMALKLNETYSRMQDDLSSVPDYDVFICVKIGLATEQEPTLDGYTYDSKLANEIYNELTNRGLKVFYSPKSIQGTDFDSQILSALYKSKMLLVISTKKEYLESAWVQSEWRRWLKFIKWNEKDRNSLILYLSTASENFELPIALKKVQYFNSQLPVINHIMDTIVPIKFKESKPIKEVVTTKEFDALKFKADQGDSQAQCKVGYCYSNGSGVDQDDIEAFNYFKKSANQGNAVAQYYLGDAYENGKGLQKNTEEAFDYYNLSAYQGNADAEERLAYFYYYGIEVKENKHKALKYYQLAAEHGNASANNMLGNFYYDGIILKKDYEKAFKKFKIAGDRGCVEAFCNIGKCYENGNGLEKNYEKAIKNYELAAEYDDIDANLRLSNIYFDNKERKECLNKAIELLNSKYSYDISSKDLSFNKRIGDLYFTGNFVQKDYCEAFVYYNKAYQDGDIDALPKLIESYKKGYGVKKNRKRAKELEEELRKINEEKGLVKKRHLKKYKPMTVILTVINILFIIAAFATTPFMFIESSLIMSIINFSLLVIVGFYNLIKNIIIVRKNKKEYLSIGNILEIIVGFLAIALCFTSAFFTFFIHNTLAIPYDQILVVAQISIIFAFGVLLFFAIALHKEGGRIRLLITFSILLILAIIIITWISSYLLCDHPIVWKEHWIQYVVVYGNGLFILCMCLNFILYVHNGHCSACTFFRYTGYFIFVALCILFFILLI